MRNLFLLLLLANLSVWVWQRWFRDTEEPVAATRDEPELVLVSETQPEPPPTPASQEMNKPEEDLVQPPVAVPEQADPPAELTAAVAPKRCVSLGPFRELAEAASAAASLKNGGLDPQQRVAEGDIWVGYWVHIDNLASRDEADQVLETLRSQGVSDSYIVQGDDGNLISLGVFSEIKRAGRRRQEVRDLGFDPIVTDRSRRGTVYWVDVVLTDPDGLDLERFQTRPGRIVRMEERPCEAV